jgi:hypothetical protein
VLVPCYPSPKGRSSERSQERTDDHSAETHPGMGRWKAERREWEEGETLKAEHTREGWG